jgi:hypothetical protein
MSITLTGLSNTTTPDNTNQQSAPFLNLGLTNLNAATAYTLTITLSHPNSGYTLTEGNQGGLNSSTSTLTISDTGDNLQDDLDSVTFAKNTSWLLLGLGADVPVNLTFNLTSPSSVSLGSESVSCFATGTRILTQRGPVAVEALRIGDRIVTARGGGRLAPVKWVGHRTLAPARHPRPWDVNPIRVRADAIGPGRPSRDLLLSPDHALFLDGILVRVRDLLNGATIVQETAPEITYWHVELDRHDVLLAEGVPAESFLDTGNRAAFENGGTAIMAHPDFSRSVWEIASCAPLVWQGARLEAVRAKLAARAEQAGWTLTDDADLHVTAGGRTIRPVVEGGTLAFYLPADTKQVCLRSRTTVPAFVLPGIIDTRVLGIGVLWMSLDGAAVPSDALGDGWLAEEGGLRWTDGAATLHTGGARRLELGVAALLRYWVAPDGEDRLPQLQAA